MEKINSNLYLHPRTRARVDNSEEQTTVESQYAAVELLRYWTLLRQRWQIIVGLTLIIALSAGLYAKFGMTKLWRAETAISPLSPTETQSQIGGNVLESLGGAGGLGALFGQGDTVTLAMRYVAIMKTYSFTTSLMDRYHLDHLVAAEMGLEPSKLTRWKLYQLISARLSYEFDYKTGNLSVYFLDRDPKEARRILSLYLDSLRDKLRSEEVQSSTAAVVSLQEEIKKTSDSLLQSQLYELLARQLQHAKLAQVQADFAFKMVEPPIVPDQYYRPSARQYAAIAGTVTLFVLCSFFLIHHWLANARAYLVASELTDATSHLSDSPRPREAGASLDQRGPSR